MVFDPKRHVIKVQGNRNYLPVSARLIWFREEHPDWGIETESVAIDIERQYAIFRCRIFNAEGKLMATGTKMENVKGFGDYIEKAETGSIGRALALCGYGTQFSPDFDEVLGNRLADSPQPMGGNRYGNNNYGGGGNSNNRQPNGGQRNGPPSNEQGGQRNAPPVNEAPPQRSAPPANDPPTQRPAPAANANPRNTPPTPSGRTGAGAAPAAEAPRPAASRPAPTPSRNEDDEDDFESLIGMADLIDDDDPFDDTSSPVVTAAPPAKATAPAAVGASPETAANNGCVSCGKALTKAQQELSIRNYGQALCPACQKDKARTPRAELAERS